MSRTFFQILSFLCLCILCSLLCGCANIGTPSGGPRDEVPPRLVNGNPAPGALNVDKKKLTLTFDEIIIVKDAFNNVVVSPTTGAVPRVSSLGRKITLDFDSLLHNTTYTIDFGDAIEDNNEGNKLQGFSYTFSTGAKLDTMRISGRVLGAYDMEPQQGMIVGVISNPTDSAFIAEKLERVAKTDDRGRFTIRGLAPGAYSVYALNDIDHDYRYSSPEEDVAFLGMAVVPSARTIETTDTLLNLLTGARDSLRTRLRTQFLPNDILLRSFNSGRRQQYLTKYERQDSSRLYLKFNTEAPSLPDVRLLADPGNPLPAIIESSALRDSIIYWLPPSLAHEDTLAVQVTYSRTDQNLAAFEVTDTLSFIYKRPKAKDLKKRNNVKMSAKDSLNLVTTSFIVPPASELDAYRPLELTLPRPALRLDTAAFHLSVLKDTVYIPVSEPLGIHRPDSLKPRNYELSYPLEFGKKYRLEIDSLAAMDIYGFPTRALKYDFSTKDLSEYSSILFNISGIDATTPAFVELLNGSDRPVRIAPLNGSEAYFPYLQPGRYYARIILDSNGNGIYDTGDFERGLQPELAYYYPKVISLKKNWDRSEAWNVFGTPADMMKPMAITKNKPQTDKRNRQNTNSQTEEEDDEQFDPTRNPFDPNDRGRRKATVGSY